MNIVEIKQLEPKVLKALNGLLPQLSASASPMTESGLRHVIDSPSSRLLVAVESEEFIGCLTLVLFHLPTGIRARIEDLVVDRSCRGKGIGKALIFHALELARAFGANGIELTSNPSRESANTLYRSMGFEHRKTNVYVLHPQERKIMKG